MYYALCKIKKKNMLWYDCTMSFKISYTLYANVWKFVRWNSIQWSRLTIAEHSSDAPNMYFTLCSASSQGFLYCNIRRWLFTLSIQLSDLPKFPLHCVLIRFWGFECFNFRWSPVPFDIAPGMFFDIYAYCILHLSWNLSCYNARWSVWIFDGSLTI